MRCEITSTRNMLLHSLTQGHIYVGSDPQTWNASDIITAIDCGCTDSMLLLRCSKKDQASFTCLCHHSHSGLWTATVLLPSRGGHVTHGHNADCDHSQMSRCSLSDVIHWWLGRRLSQNGRCYYSGSHDPVICD